MFALLEEDHETNTFDKVVLLSCRIKSFDVIVLAVTMKFVSGSMVTLSEKPQKKTSDLFSVCEMIQDLK